MNWLSAFLNSSIGKKLLMALTGLFLCTFLLVHMTGNLQLFKDDGGYAFNTYTVFMTTSPLIKTISYGLYFIILFHAVWGISIGLANKKARPVSYQVPGGNASSKWASRNMGILGTLILAFIVLHMSGFWAKYKFGELPYKQYMRNMVTNEMSSDTVNAQLSSKLGTTMETFKTSEMGGMYEVTLVKDMYGTVKMAFQEWWIVLLYLIGMAAISFHLIHGFKSAFQTLGVHHSKYNNLINFIGVGIFGILIPIVFAAMPLYFFLT